MKIKVNAEACIGCGACCAIAEELFEINDEGLSVAKVTEITEEQKEAFTDAMESCPTGAIVEDTEEKKENQ